MRVIRTRCNIGIIYLIAVFFYSIAMIFSILENTIATDNSTHLQEPPVEEENMKLKRKRISGHQSRSIESVEDFFGRLETVETHCRKMVEVGGSSCGRTMDHNKMMCMDSDVLILNKNCTVYSFGIGTDMTFDLGMHKYGCEVHMFDPTIPISMVENDVSERLMFHPIGIHIRNTTGNFEWSFDDKDKLDMTVHGKFDTYSNIRKQLRHENRTVQYFKMDVDGTEWDVIPTMVSEGHFETVSQFAIEIHANKILRMKSNNHIIAYLQVIWNILQKLKDVGFMKVSYIPTPVLESTYYHPITNQSISTCGEILFIKRTPGRFTNWVQKHIQSSKS